jgi:TetR/AcrR family tetracycline transcriptional repressor
MAGTVKTRHGLSTERVVDAGLLLADEGGLGSLTIRRLAGALGVTPMAIYRHVRHKDHLLDLMADRLLEGMVYAATEPRAWQERLRNLAASLLAVLEAHPSAPFLLSRPFDSVLALRLSEALLEILDAAGFDARESVRLLQIVTGMILGPGIHRATYAATWRNRTPDPGRQPAAALATAEFPFLSDGSELLADWSAGPEADRLTIELLVEGIEALARVQATALGSQPRTRRGSGRGERI